MVVSLLRFLIKSPFWLFMAVFSRLYSAFKWFWRNACLFWCCPKRVLNPIWGYVVPPLRWLKGSGSQSELQRNAEDPPEVEKNRPEGQHEAAEDPWEVEKSRPEGQHEAAEDPWEVEKSRPEGQHEAAGKRAAHSDRELARKRPRFEDDDGEFDGEEYRVDHSDDFYCGYDSTWEAEEPPWGTHPRTRRPPARNDKFSRFESAARDMQNYRHGYPSQMRQQHFNQVSDDKPNLQFYLGKKCSVPDGVYIYSFHQKWYEDYSKLESVHSYIQWLFPLQEPGMNSMACTLTKEEIKEFCQNDTAKANLLKSYKLMLNFYGIMLCDEKNGNVKRASNWKDRFNNLNRQTHNNLRITRILKCLGTLGYPHYQAPLVRFFLEETLVHGELPRVKDSVLSYFLFAVLDKRERKKLIKFAYLSYSRKEEFVWCPRKIQMIWLQGIKGRKETWECDQNQLSQYSEDESQDDET